ncbi:MAG TPA: putative 2-aminoethylphosphonate ABC transporter ATP-binding protein [Candidatus Methylomirabilis sp.]|nr:putative 2-aminoethylphosphonate ABC transporter ATP-binding protein [Candidatus Methylomirabilis sp.]
MYLQVTGVTKTFGRFSALQDILFGARRGELLCILGPSGCGKTTLLRVVAGLEIQDSGRVFIEGRDVSSLPVSKRNVGIVFQSYALFPNLTAVQNIGYGLRNRSGHKTSIGRRVEELLQLVGLEGMGRRYPAQLSGGQQQRVALARAMALSPNLLLLDEPLSALDAQVRILLRSEIRLLQRRLGVTTLMVTHDQEEALTMADRIVVMDRGRIVQDGTPFEIYNKPATPFVASFIGSMNFIEKAVKESAGLYRIGALSLRVENGSGPLAPGAQVTMAIRPEDIVVRKAGEDTPNTVTAHISGLEFRGPHYRVTLRLSDNGETPILRADIPTEAITRLGLREAMDIGIHLPPDRIRVYTS